MARPDDWDRARALQLRNQDEKLMDFRRFYDGISVEQRAEYKTWLEKASALDSECPFEGGLRHHLENEELDDNGQTSYYRNIQMTPFMMLRAMGHWDKGEPFVPETAFP